MRTLLLCALILLAACKVPFSREAWNREYVLYDAAAERREAEELERVTAERDALAKRLAEQGGAAEAVGRDVGPVERIFEIQANIAELDRAIADGLDENGTLAARRAGLATELDVLVEAHRDAYETVRRARLEALKAR